MQHTWGRLKNMSLKCWNKNNKDEDTGAEWHLKTTACSIHLGRAEERISWIIENEGDSVKNIYEIISKGQEMWQLNYEIYPGCISLLIHIRRMQFRKTTVKECKTIFLRKNWIFFSFFIFNFKKIKACCQKFVQCVSTIWR